MKISKFCNFWAISTCNTSKESIFHIEFNFIQKKYDLFEKIWKKSNFSDFFFKTDADHLSSFANFSNLYQKISKLSLSVLWKGFEIKSHQRRTHYLERPRNGGCIPARGGGTNPPPPLLGLRKQEGGLFSKNHNNCLPPIRLVFEVHEHNVPQKNNFLKKNWDSDKKRMTQIWKLWEKRNFLISSIAHRCVMY